MGTPRRCRRPVAFGAAGVGVTAEARRHDRTVGKAFESSLTCFVAAPSAAVILADLGADITKAEPPGGDPLRGMMRPPTLPDGSPPLDPPEVDNRG